MRTKLLTNVSHTAYAIENRLGAGAPVFSSTHCVPLTMTPVHPYPPLPSASKTVQAVKLSTKPFPPFGPHVALNSSPFMLHGCFAAHVWYLSW